MQLFSYSLPLSSGHLNSCFPGNAFLHKYLLFIFYKCLLLLILLTQVVPTALSALLAAIHLVVNSYVFKKINKKIIWTDYQWYFRGLYLLQNLSDLQ